MSPVRRWVVAGVVAYGLGTFGWCLTGAIRKDPTDAEAFAQWGATLILIGGAAGAIAYIAGNAGPTRG
jgi:hypothetical protein